MHGNRASIGPSRGSIPDTNAFLTHIAGNSEPSNAAFVQASTNAGGFEEVGDKITYTPQYAHRNHGDESMLGLPETFEDLQRALAKGEIRLTHELYDKLYDKFYDKFARPQELDWRLISNRIDGIIEEDAELSQGPHNPHCTQE